MCGRFAIDAVLSQRVSDQLGVRFVAPANADVRPTQPVATLADRDGQLAQLDLLWGIQPEWASRPLINAKAETAASKNTFARAFAERRCVVPCSGWYEWRDEGGPAKHKYLFSHAAGEPLFMAGIWFHAQPGEPAPRMVILTIRPNVLCGRYHDRMPLLIHPDDLGYWLRATVAQLAPLLGPPPEEAIRVSGC